MVISIFSDTVTLTVAVDNGFELFEDGVKIGEGHRWTKAKQFEVSKDAKVLAFLCNNLVSKFLGKTKTGSG
jgi:hypothetical protein